MGASQSSARIEGNTTPGMNMRSNYNRNRNRNRNRNMAAAGPTTYMGGGKRSRRSTMRKSRKSRRRTSKGRK